MSKLDDNIEREDKIAMNLQPQAYELWLQIGERLLVGQERYGGFKFGEHDLDKMAAEELEDLIVYLSAKTFLKKYNQFGEVSP